MGNYEVEVVRFGMWRVACGARQPAYDLRTSQSKIAFDEVTLALEG